MTKRKPPRRRQTRAEKVEAYHDLLLGTGMHPREAARAAVYAMEKGFKEMETHQDPDGCLIFDIPDCGNLDCLNPNHQVFDTSGEHKK